MKNFTQTVVSSTVSYQLSKSLGEDNGPYFSTSELRAVTLQEDMNNILKTDTRLHMDSTSYYVS